MLGHGPRNSSRRRSAEYSVKEDLSDRGGVEARGEQAADPADGVDIGNSMLQFLDATQP